MTYKRNEAGLLEGVDYKFNDDGSVDWRAMVDPKHLYPNKGWFESRGEPMPRSSEGLADHQLLIKLSGIKELAKLRGFNRVHYDIIKCELDHVSVKCEINWIPNFENQNATYLKKGNQSPSPSVSKFHANNLILFTSSTFLPLTRTDKSNR